MKYIIGLGNMMRGDDGIGSSVIEYILNNRLEQDFYALDFATNAWGILPLLTTETEKILLIDCSYMQETPGTVKFFPLDCVVNQDKASVENHESSITQLVKVATLAGYHIPTIYIMGIEPVCIKTELSLSAVLENKLVDYAEDAVNFIQTSTR
jgi:hydrogenase maturation protease